MSKCDDATLITTNNELIFLKINYIKLLSKVKEIVKNADYNISLTFESNDKTFESIMSSDYETRIGDLLKIYHLTNPNFKIDHSTYMGIFKENEIEYAVFLSGKMPPEDLYDKAIVISSTDFEQLCQNIRIRTRILDESNQLIAIIVSSHYLESYQLNIKFQLTH